MSDCFVYLIASRKDDAFVTPIKVGISHDVDKRIRSIRTSCPNRIDVVQTFRFPNSSVARLIESMFHNLHRENRRSGEWFDVEPKIALATLLNAVTFHMDELKDVPEHFFGEWLTRTNWYAAYDLVGAMP